VAVRTRFHASIVGCQGYSLTARLGKAKDELQTLALDNDIQIQVKRHE
jgi:hypothetical protein